MIKDKVLGRGSWVVGRGSWVVGRGSWVVGRGSWVVGSVFTLATFIARNFLYPLPVYLLV